MRADRDLRIALIIITVAAAVRLAMAAAVPVVPDEAYYWAWSRHLAAGYFDHPPAIALLIRAGTAIAGDTPFGLRLIVNVIGYVATIAAIGLTYRLGGGAAARRAAWVVAAMPLAGAGLVLATPDVPLLAAAAVGVLAIDLALTASAAASLGWWLVAGCAFGLALDAKYTAVLLGAGVAIALVVHPGLRAEWRRPGVYVACVAAALLFLPVVRWNATHDWVSFRFQLQHGLAPKGSSGPLTRELDLLGGQLLLVSPLLFVGLVTAVAGALRRQPPRRALLAIVATFLAAFFVWSALRRSVEPNWLAPAVLIAAIVYASGPRLRWERVAIGLGGLMVLAIYVQVLAPFLPFPARRDPSAQGAGWRQAALHLDAVWQAQRNQRDPATVWLAANRYQDAAEFAFHLPRHPTVYSLNIGGRPNQYDLWPRFPQVARTGDVLILVLPEESRTPEAIFALLPHCTSMTRDETLELRRGGELIGVRRIWTCTGWRGTWPAAAPPASSLPPHTTFHIWHRPSPATSTRSSPPTPSGSNASSSIFSVSPASARNPSTTPIRRARRSGCRPPCGRPASRRRS